MDNNERSVINVASLLALGLLPTFAHASGGFGCGSGDSFLCPFWLWNAGIGIMFLGIPISIAAFTGLYLSLIRAGWTALKRILWGVIHGLAVFEIAVFFASIVLPLLERINLPVPGQLAGFIGAYVMLLIGSLIYIVSKRSPGGMK